MRRGGGLRSRAPLRLEKCLRVSESGQLSQLAESRLRLRNVVAEERMSRRARHCGEDTGASRGRAALPQTAYISLKAVVIP